MKWFCAHWSEDLHRSAVVVWGRAMNSCQCIEACQDLMKKRGSLRQDYVHWTDKKRQLIKSSNIGFNDWQQKVTHLIIHLCALLLFVCTHRPFFLMFLWVWLKLEDLDYLWSAGGSIFGIEDNLWLLWFFWRKWIRKVFWKDFWIFRWIIYWVKAWELPLTQNSAQTFIHKHAHDMMAVIWEVSGLLSGWKWSSRVEGRGLKVGQKSI